MQPSFKLLVILSLICFVSCGQKEDSRVEQLQKDVARLNQENERLRNEMQQLYQKVQSNAHPVPTQTSVNTAQTSETRKEITVEEMKTAVKPLVVDFIKKLKAASETPSKNDQFGMRMEYDIPSAVYGLVRTNDEEAPYSAKVIVKYEKFLETTSNSKSYGIGTTTFYFTYENDHWSLQTFE
jgi:hypothetical protein